MKIIDRQQIDAELSRLIALRAEFYLKDGSTAAEVQEFEQAGKRIRELFVQLAQLNQQRETVPSRALTQPKCRKRPSRRWQYGLADFLLQPLQ